MENEFEKGPFNSFVFQEGEELKEAKLPESVWERAEKVFGERQASPESVRKFIVSDNATKVQKIGEN